MNVNKCVVLSVTKQREPICYPYMLSMDPIQRTDLSKDLGVLVDSGSTRISQKKSRKQTKC